MKIYKFILLFLTAVYLLYILEDSIYLNRGDKQNFVKRETLECRDSFFICTVSKFRVLKKVMCTYLVKYSK